MRFVEAPAADVDRVALKGPAAAAVEAIVIPFLRRGRGVGSLFHWAANRVLLVRCELR